MRPCPLITVQPVGSPPATGALTVEKYRVIHIIIFDQTDHHGSLLHSLHLIQSLGEEVNAHGNACRDGALYVLLVSGIDNQRTCRRTPVSTADNGKFHTRILHRLPVDFLIPLGNIDAELRAAFVKLQLHILCAVRILLGAVDRLILLFRVDVFLRHHQILNIVKHPVLDILAYLYRSDGVRHTEAVFFVEKHTVLPGAQAVHINHAILVVICVFAHILNRDSEIRSCHQASNAVYHHDPQILGHGAHHQGHTPAGVGFDALKLDLRVKKGLIHQKSRQVASDLPILRLHLFLLRSHFLLHRLSLRKAEFLFHRI